MLVIIRHIECCVSGARWRELAFNIYFFILVRLRIKSGNRHFDIKIGSNGQPMRIDKSSLLMRRWRIESGGSIGLVKTTKLLVNSLVKVISA